MKQQKLLIGPRIRRLRLSRKLTQTEMAKQLSISTSYLNLIERNQRPVSAKLLLGLVETYNVEISELSQDEDIQTINEIRDLLKTDSFKDLNVSRDEVEDAVGASPELMKAFIGLNNRVRELAVQAAFGNGNVANRGADGGGGAGTTEVAIESVRTYLEENRNYFHDIDQAAAKMFNDLDMERRRPHTSLTARLEDKHGIRVRIVPADLLPGRLSQFNPHASRLELSELLPQAGRRFRIAFRLGLLEYGHVITETVSRALLPSAEADALCRVNLANYFAGAVLMPYDRIFKLAEDYQYDVERLSRAFDTSYEQTAHRLTTLQRKDARGVPFFFVRVDVAGNVSKRFSSGRFHFSKFGGACPLWNIHNCFKTPGETLPQKIEMPDGTRYLALSRAVLRPGGAYGQPAQLVAIGLGCEEKHAGRLVYGKDMDGKPATPVGVNCYLCERANCRSRAFAPLSKPVDFDERTRGESMFGF